MMVLDLDGTLLNGESKLEEGTKYTLQRAMKEGKKITLCSSRSYEEMRNIAEILYKGCGKQYCIGFGGACIYDQDGHVVASRSKIEKENAEFLIEEATCRNIHIHGYDETMLYYFQNTEAFQIFLHFANVEHIPMKCISYKEFKEKGFLKLMCLGETAKLNDYYNIAERVGYTVFSNPKGQQGYLDICQKFVSKGTSVELLCNTLMINSQECICVGDGENDISMLRYAGFGIAMKNAGDKVKKSADYVVPYTNCENAIAYLVKEFLK